MIKRYSRNVKNVVINGMKKEIVLQSITKENGYVITVGLNIMRMNKMARLKFYRDDKYCKLYPDMREA